jgi:thioredoxin reductase (NADPH)
MRTVIVDAVAVGGQAATSARIENYLGFPAGLSGAELAERAALQAEKFDVRILVPREAVGLRERDGLHLVDLADGEVLTARVVILAMGVQYRRLAIAGLERYEGLGVAYATDTARRQLRTGDAAMVVGGANSAGQMALALAEDGRRVHLVVRGETLARTMAAYLRNRVALDPQIEVHLQTEVRELAGEGHLEQVVVEDTPTGRRQTLAVGVMVVLIGAAARTAWLAHAIDLDEDGFVLTGPALNPTLSGQDPWVKLGRAPLMLETSSPGVFAVGDVRSGSTRMVAPAVGDGGMAVRLAAEHLARAPA